MGADRRYGTIPKMARASAVRFGGRDAVVDSEARLSFADLDREMMAVARSLIAGGVEPGDRLALWAPNSLAWIVAALGVLASGAWLVPLNTRLKGEEAAYILEKTDARSLFAPDGFLGTDYFGSLRAVAPHIRALQDRVTLPSPGHYGGAAWDEFLARGRDVPVEDAEARLAAGTADDISDVIFTSGTTGNPKGVMLRHGASLRGFEVYNESFQLDKGDRYMIPNPFFHCFGYKAGWMVALLTGATTFPVAVFDAGTVLEEIQRERITHVAGSPTIFWAVLDHPRRQEYDLSSLRHARVGAASILPLLIHRMRDELGVDSVISGYGLTENHALVSLTRPSDSPEVVATTVGRPLAGLEVRIVDDAGQDRPLGEPGELLVRGFLLMSGYYDDEEVTAETIVDGWLYTGDIAVLDADGYVRITDRKKDMFIVGGFNVAPAEVEKSLLGLEQIAQVAVVGMPDDYFGEVGAAFVIPKDGSGLTADEVVAYAREHLANFKVPRRVEIVDAFPVNATGKVLKNELRRRVRQPPPVEPM
jgi:acyl-CoA synthetase (AMP-forming)/AMP-acid ligase II